MFETSVPALERVHGECQTAVVIHPRLWQAAIPAVKLVQMC